MNSVKIATLIFLIALPLSGFCGHYKYIDENGTVHFVEDPSRIPDNNKQEDTNLIIKEKDNQQFTYYDYEDKTDNSESKEAIDIVNKIDELEAKKEKAYDKIDQLKDMRESTERNFDEVMRKLNSK